MPVSLIEQTGECHIVVHSFSVPTRNRGPGIDVNAFLLVHTMDFIPFERRRVLMVRPLKRPAMVAEEFPTAVFAPLDHYFALMHHAMVGAAQGNEVREFGFAAVRPVFNMMGVDVLMIGATRETAALISGVQRTAKRGWDDSSLSPDIQRLAALVLDDAYETGIARHATRGFERQGRSMFELAAAVLAGPSMS